MPECKSCSAPIFFAWDRRFDKWVPVDLTLVRGDEVELTDARGRAGVVREDFHLRHMCGFTPQVRLGAPNPHRVLFVAQDAPKEVIRASYLALAKHLHPDAGGSVEEMTELNEAYESAMSTAVNLKR